MSPGMGKVPLVRWRWLFPLPSGLFGSAYRNARVPSVPLLLNFSRDGSDRQPESLVERLYARQQHNLLRDLG